MLGSIKYFNKYLEVKILLFDFILHTIPIGIYQRYAIILISIYFILENVIGRYVFITNA